MLDIEVARTIMNSLKKNYITERLPKHNRLLTDIMYYRNDRHNPKCNILGDYSYMVLMREQNPNWQLYG